MPTNKRDHNLLNEISISLFSKFVVYTSLFFFFLFFALRADNFISWSYWFVFLPLWLWKGIVFVSAIVGVVVWILRRNDPPTSSTPSVDGDVNNLPNNAAGQHSRGVTATTRHFKGWLVIGQVEEYSFQATSPVDGVCCADAAKITVYRFLPNR